MATPDITESISLLGEALQNLMVAEEGLPGEPIQAGDTTEFHRYMDLPSHIRGMIREEAFDEEDGIARLASVSKEWQKVVEGYVFDSIRIDPSIEEDVLRFKQLFNNERTRYLKLLEIIFDDRLTGPWHLANGIVQISLIMEKVRMLFYHIKSWSSNQVGDLEINFVSPDMAYEELNFDGLFEYQPYIRTTSLWTENQLRFLGNSNLASDKPLWAIWSESPKDFDVVKWLTFPLDCVPLPTTMAIIETMPNLVSCQFELAFQRMAVDPRGEVDTRASEQGVARLADFFQRLPTLAPSLRDLSIRVPHDEPPIFEGASAHRLSAALRDCSQCLSTLKIDGIHMHENFFELFGKEEPVVAASKLRWPNLKELKMGIVTYGPSPGPLSNPDQPSLTPTQLLIAAGRATMAMPLLTNFEVEMWDESVDLLTPHFSISRATPHNLESCGQCTVTLRDFTKDQDQKILCAWTPFMGAKARLVSKTNWPFTKETDHSSWNLSDQRVYKTFPEERILSTTFGAGALVNNARFLQAQQLARTDSGIGPLQWFGSRYS